MRSTKRILCAVALMLATAAVSAYVVDQPRMQAARNDLQKARAELRAGSSDKGGHRNKAIGYVDSAISEVAAGIRFDRRHDDESAGFDQPHMQAALNHLQSARGNLEAAADDKGGHRVKAIEYVNKAIEEVNKGIEYDRTH
jgi:opacity protein-like surface antigen